MDPKVKNNGGRKIFGGLIFVCLDELTKSNLNN
jgi:hypothetical protein